MSKPITALAILLLAQDGKLKVTDTIDRFNIKVPYNNKITIQHLLQHTSGIYDFSSELYFKLNPKQLFNKILDKYKTRFVDFSTAVLEINNNKPYFKPKNPNYVDLRWYSNTGYDILGYIIYVVSGVKTDVYIKHNIFRKLKMINSGFQTDEHPNESIPYENNKKRGIKEQQNWYCGNGNIACTLRDYNKFIDGHSKLLNSKYMNIYKKIYFFGRKDKYYKYFWHMGGGDFSHNHSNGGVKYSPLTKSIMVKFYNNRDAVNIVISENYENTNSFFGEGHKNYNYFIEKIISNHLLV